MDAARRGATALEDGKIATAIQEYTTALSSNPQAVTYYIQRSIAYARAKPPEHATALMDAETAVVLAHRRGKSELIAQAQMRRAVSLYGLGQFADCRMCLDWSEARNKADKAIPIWRMKVEDKLNGLPVGDGKGSEEDEAVARRGREVTVEEVPKVDVDERIKKMAVRSKPSEATTTASSGGATAQASTSGTALAQVQTSGVSSSTQPTAQATQTFTPASKIRHDWYQNNETVTVSLMAKGVPKDSSTSVDLQVGSLSISFPLPSGSDYDFSLDPLWATIVPAESSYKVMSTKVEFILRKAVQGQKWPALEATAASGTKGLEHVAGAEGASSTDETARRAALSQPSPSQPTKPTGPAYPTSSRTGPKDWDKVVSDLSKKKPSSSAAGENKSSGSGGVETATAGGDGDDDGLDDDDDGGDEVNSFFKKLYKNADPDTRRAMMKSYTESNGTALSTNWGEVETKKYDTVPPDGMEAKKW